MEISDFSIANDFKKTFKLLTQGMYKDPLKATIRELVLNALEEQGKISFRIANRPLEIKFDDNILEIKDFGRGIQKKDLHNAITEYFKSQNGLGLGLKSPFSICNHFDIISISRDITFEATAYISENGLPSIRIITEKKQSFTETGTTIRIPIQEVYKDKVFSLIREVVLEANCSVKVKYNNSDFEETKQDNPTLSLDHLRSSLPVDFPSYIGLVINRVLYPIDEDKLPKPLINTFKTLNTGFF